MCRKEKKRIINYEFKRGDTNPLGKFGISDVKGESIQISDSDNIYFTMKNDNEEVVIQKTFNNGIELEEDGYYHITLEPNDTESLEPDVYDYDIELNINSSTPYVKTIIEGKIKILKDITTGGDKK